MYNYIILGGGPVGCYLAYKLLKQGNCRVFIVESRKFVRPQVMRIPFSIARDLPEFVKNIMWFDEETRNRIFNSGHADDENFWPKPDYLYCPYISIGLFQESMIQFLQNHVEYNNRFFFIPVHFDLGEMSLRATIENIFSINHSSILGNITAIYCTCGIYAKHLRNELNLLDGKVPEFKGHGFYLIYQNRGKESYRRDTHLISYPKLGENGISYAVSNNCNYDVQLYTYPAGVLSAILNDIPEEITHLTKYGSQVDAFDMTGVGLSNRSRMWLEHYKEIIFNEINKVGIEMPFDLTKIKIFYASRSEYYWNVVTTKDFDASIFFLGDSAGSTDYKFGLSLGRGFLAVDMVTNSMQRNHNDFDKVSASYQTYWNSVISREFNKGPMLTLEPWIQYQYLIKGREVHFSNKQSIHYIHDEQYENYLGEYQNLVT